MRLRFTTALGMVAALLLAMLLGGAVPAQAAAVSPAGEQGFAQIAACAASSDNVLAAIVVDSSGSLAQTDPSNARVKAIGVALDSLEALQTSSDGRLRVDASLSTFANTFKQRVGWGSVSGSHGGELRQVAQSALPGATSGGTDYRAALQGAQRSLDDEARAQRGTSCKVLLWFTDGGLDIGAGTAAAASQICEQQGIADSVRRDGIAVIALALFTSGGNDGVTQSDRDRLKAIAETDGGGGKTCGTSPLPAGATGGAYLRASDADALTRLFAQAAAMIGGATPRGSVACPGSNCVKGVLTVPLDQAVSGFRLVATDVTGTPYSLTAPDGTQISLGAASTTPGVSGSTVTVTNQDALTTVDVRREGGVRTDQAWVLRTPTGTPVQVDRYYYWGARIGVSAVQKIVVGQPDRIGVTLRNPDGSLVNTKWLSSISLDMTVDGRPFTLTPVSSGTWSTTVRVPSADVAPALHVIVSARATSAGHRIALGPVTATADLATSLPASFPTISPNRLALPQAVGTKTTSGVIHFSGSAAGPTKACFLRPTVSGPQGAGAVTLRPAEECVQIPAGASKTVTVEASLARGADGRVDGVLPIRLTGAHGDVATLRLPVGFVTARPVDEPVRWALIVLFVFLAIALAWVSAEVARRLSDRYLLTTDAAVASVPVLFDTSGVRRADSTSDKLLDAETDFQSMRLAGRSRPADFMAGGVRFGRAFPFWPTRAGRAIATPADGAIIVAPRGPRDLAVDKAATHAQIAFPGSTGTVLVIEPSDVRAESDPVRGRLVMLIDERNGVSSVLADRVDEVLNAGWDRITDRVRSAAAVRTAQRPAPAPRQERTSTAAPAPSPDQQAVPAPTVSGGLMDWAGDDAAPGSGPSDARTRARGHARPSSPEPSGERDPFDPPPSSSSVNFLD